MTTTDRQRGSFQAAETRWDFDQLLDRSELDRLKWEYEVARSGNPKQLGFGTADLDFRSAPKIVDALVRTAQIGHFGYPYKPDSYYDALIGFYDRHFGWRIEREWIASNVGIYPSMRPLIAELSEPGDEIVYQSPVHFQFAAVVAAAGRVPLANPLVHRDGRFEMDLEHLASIVTTRTKLLLLCNPHNPVGRTWTREELASLSAFCAERGIVVISDEVYCGLLLKGAEFVPFATASREAALNSVILTSASKMFNLTGLKHSQVIAENPRLMAAYMKGLRQDTLSYGGSIFGHVAHEVAYRDCDDWLTALMDYIEGNFAFSEQFIAERLPGIGLYQRPEATYFMWLDFRRYRLPANDLKDLLDRRHGLSLNYGEDLGPGGEGHIRLSLGTQRSILAEGLERLEVALKDLPLR